MTAKAKADVEKSLEEIKDFKQELEKLEVAKKVALDELNFRWMDIADDITTLSIQPYKKDITVDLFGIGWLPYYIVDIDGRRYELSGFTL